MSSTLEQRWSAFDDVASLKDVELPPLGMRPQSLLCPTPFIVGAQLGLDNGSFLFFNVGLLILYLFNHSFGLT